MNKQMHAALTCPLSHLFPAAQEDTEVQGLGSSQPASSNSGSEVCMSATYHAQPQAHRWGRGARGKPGFAASLPSLALTLAGGCLPTFLPKETTPAVLSSSRVDGSECPSSRWFSEPLPSGVCLPPLFGCFPQLLLVLNHSSKLAGILITNPTTSH